VTRGPSQVWWQIHSSPLRIRCITVAMTSAGTGGPVRRELNGQPGHTASRLIIGGDAAGR